MEKQIEKVKCLIANPSKNKKFKLTKTSGQAIELNKNCILIYRNRILLFSENGALLLSYYNP
ncbi:hypothetical protein D6B99_02910 [Arachidicoccus soli]|uniref:Uncharacterized protein n=1 Tax=Arachidicoccus soli TaxID=2341117 RepID=A0A386HL85_9BACT|nr:hypothetical protein D6B99_02910 [Arachidicoccus soli]